MAITWMPTSVTFPKVIYELQCIGQGKMYVQAFNSIPPHGVKYRIMSGEFPPSLTLNENTGQITGTVDLNEISAPQKVKVPPEGFRFNETNYLKYHTSGVALEFVVRAYTNLPAFTYSDINAVMYVRTNWSARRDRLILNINNQFYLDGFPVDNDDYLEGQKAKGYFPGPDCNTEV